VPVYISAVIEVYQRLTGWTETIMADDLTFVRIGKNFIVVEPSNHS
jgi:hypothetical protein